MDSFNIYGKSPVEKAAEDFIVWEKITRYIEEFLIRAYGIEPGWLENSTAQPVRKEEDNAKGQFNA